MRFDVSSVLAITLATSSCANRVESPEDVLTAYAQAVESTDWRRIYEIVGADVRRGMTLEEFEEYCDENLEFLQEQARQIQALHPDDVAVTARVPVGRIREVETVHVDGRWRLVDQVPLLDGADTPTESMSALASALQSDGVIELLSLLSEDAEDRYLAEIDALVEALLDADERRLSVFGDSATVSIGEITISLVREDGAWQVSSVAQPPSYDAYDYYY